ncbi:hypothetical protein D9758_010274 [Tetrapyrgos nigripes]|uniref:Uncharacterized protein n=1 Tax=Tetrapyrgos nigripes TaxID=182062 RepID=A0A8H5LKW5_9AGAR|nr:hypothetical protein D9758_010274 [Tetrapyrgos nigripes]
MEGRELGIPSDARGGTKSKGSLTPRCLAAKPNTPRPIHTVKCPIDALMPIVSPSQQHLLKVVPMDVCLGAVMIQAMPLV